MISEHLYSAIPFAAAAVVYYMSPTWTRLAVKKIAREHGTDPHASDDAMRYPLDWAIDLTQLIFVLFLPVAAVFIARPNEVWTVALAVLAGIALAIAVV